MSDDRVTTIAPEDANGLEAGLVIVVNPGHWQFDAEIDSRLLYVALTRTMGRLVVVHTGRLPVGLSRNLGPQSNSAKVAQQQRNKKKSSRFKKSRATNRAKKPTKSAAGQDPAGKLRRAMFGFKRKKQSKKR
jgi:superfamily I DNA/RNA helicase